MAFAFLAGTLVALFAALLVAAYYRAPTRQSCPECGSRTSAVRIPGWLAGTSRFVSHRWCAECAWEGLGRAGPEWTPGEPVAHDSGFRFGQDVMGPNDGFRWGERAEPPGKPSHPSGFRFSTRPDTDEADTIGRADHPTGFRWARGPIRGPVFQWASRHTNDVARPPDRAAGGPA